MGQPTALERQQLTQVESSLGTFWHRVRSAIVGEALAGDGVRSVVDIGAGAGHLGGLLRVRFPDVAYRFMEPIPDVLERLVERFGVNAVVNELGEVGQFDAVTMLDVLEHIEHDDVYLADLYGAMRPGSLLVMTVPAHPFLFSSWDTRLGHYRRYSRRLLESTTSAAGFRVERCRYLFPELQIPAFLRKRSTASTDDPAEFPDLPVWLDRVAYAVSRTTSRLGRLSPGGTSLLVVARRP